MRYTRAALLIFGLGLTLGFVIAVGEFARFGRVAAAVMALGLVLLPLALVADRGVALRAWIAARLPRVKPGRPAVRRQPAARAAGRLPRRRRG